MERHEKAPLIEALLFACDEPLTIAAIRKVADDITPADIRDIMDGLKAEYDEGARGISLLEVAGGFVLVTRETWAPWVEKLMKGKRKVRLSRAALETVAVVAYKQPITRGEIERIRGVDAGGVLATLLERDLVMIKGRDAGPGKPLLYGTTQEFLNYFGLNKISDLPRLDELSAIAAKNPAWSDAEKARFERAGILPIEFDGQQPENLALGAEAAIGADVALAEPGEHGLPEGLEAVDPRHFREPLSALEEESSERPGGEDGEA